MDKNWTGLQIAMALGLAVIAFPARAVTRAHESLIYRGSFAGVKVIDLFAGVDLREDGYQVGIEVRTTGAMDLLMHSHFQSLADGQWQGSRALPRRYVSAGVMRGNERDVEITYPDGQPHVATLVPAIEPDRDPVPLPLQRDTIDGLSALASLLQNVVSTGGCDGEVTVFDGHVASHIQARSGGQEELPTQSDSPYRGSALRCDITTTPLAGFPRDSKPDDSQRRPRHSTVWLARLQEGGPLMPVRMEVELRIAGHMTLVLTKANS